MMPVAPIVIALPWIFIGPVGPLLAPAEVLANPDMLTPVRSLLIVKLAVLKLSNRTASLLVGVWPRLQFPVSLQFALFVPFQVLSVTPGSAAVAVPANNIPAK